MEERKSTKKSQQEFQLTDFSSHPRLNQPEILDQVKQEEIIPNRSSQPPRPLSNNQPQRQAPQIQRQQSLQNPQRIFQQPLPQRSYLPTSRIAYLQSNCSGCRSPLLYPPGSFSIRCPICRITTVVGQSLRLQCVNCFLIIAAPIGVPVFHCICGQVYNNQAPQYQTSTFQVQNRQFLNHQQNFHQRNSVVYQQRGNVQQSQERMIRYQTQQRIVGHSGNFAQQRQDLNLEQNSQRIYRQQRNMEHPGAADEDRSQSSRVIVYNAPPIVQEQPRIEQEPIEVEEIRYVRHEDVKQENEQEKFEDIPLSIEERPKPFKINN